VIVAAVAVGLFLLNRGLAERDVEAGPADEPVAAQPAEPETADDPATPAEEVTQTPPETPVPAVAEPRPPSEVRVLVLNGSGRQGVAARGTQFFSQAGYDTAEPENAPGPGPSAIVYADGYAEEANAAAVALGLDPALVVRPLDPAAPPIADTQGANLVVVAGTDGLITF
jgi:hypothetical protein